MKEVTLRLNASLIRVPPETKKKQLPARSRAVLPVLERREQASKALFRELTELLGQTGLERIC